MTVKDLSHVKIDSVNPFAGLMHLKQLILTKPMVCESVLFAIGGIFLTYILKVCDGCHDLMQKHISFKNVAIVYFKINDYRIHTWL